MKTDEFSISALKQHYYNADYQQFYTLAQKINNKHPHYWEAQLYFFRTIQERGNFAEANQFLKQCIAKMKNNPFKPYFLLWEVFSDTFVNNESEIEVKINQLNTISGDNSPSFQALKWGFKVRLIELGINLGLLSAMRKSDAITWYEQSYQHYIQSSQPEEALITQWKMANLLLKGVQKSVEKARTIVQNIIIQSEQIEYYTMLIDCQLLIAELDFETAINANELDFEQVNKTYSQIEELAAKYQSPQNVIKVYYALGSLLLEYGFDSGLDLLKRVIEEYKIIGDYAQQQQSWRNISRWHLLRAEEKECLLAETEVNRLNTEVSINLSHDIETMYKVFTAQKQGDVSYVFNEIEGKNTTNAWTKNQLLTLKANTLITAGRRDEGIALMKDLVAIYAKVEVNSFYSEALFNLANVVASTNITECVGYMKHAIAIDEKLEDNYALAQRYMQLASHLFYANKPHLQITLEIEDYLVKALDYANSAKKLDYLIQLGNIHQTQGQLYSAIKDYAKAGPSFTKAENIFASLGIKPQLAFTLSHQGLCLLKIAREFRNLHTYDNAFGRFEEAATLFREANLYTSLWRTVFHQALCRYELAQNLDQQSEAFSQCLAQAESLFQEAALIVDELRYRTDNTDGLQKQLSVASFGADKQELYQQAFYANFWLKKDNAKALQWLERMKSQAFLEEISRHNITLKRTNTYDDYKALHIQLERANDEAQQQQLTAQINELLSNMLKDSRIVKNDGFKEVIVDYQQIREAIAQEEQRTNHKIVVIEYFCTPNLTLAFGLRSDWEQPMVERIFLDYLTLQTITHDFFHKPEGVRTAVAEPKERFLEAFEQKNVADTTFEKQWKAFSHLIAPIELWTSPDDLVCLIPHGILHDLPLHTLNIKNQYLIERNPVFYSPSLSILNLSLQKPITKPHAQCIVFGNATEDLHFAEEEAKYVAQKLQAQLFLKEQVTKSHVIESYQSCKILHFAGHAKAETTNGLEQYILLANKDRLTARELFDLKTEADLIVLSGCETGVNEYKTGDELFGMIRSILLTGADSILVSQWAVKDASTARLFTHFYDHYTQHNKAHALQSAMKAMIGKGYGFYHWGAFVLIGRF